MPPPAGSQVSRVPAQRTPPEELAPPAVAPAPPPPRRRLRTVLTVVAGVLAVMCLGGGVTGYLLYDRATTPDRSSPTVVVDSYLRAFLVDHNDVRADLFTCDDGTNLEQVRLLRSDLAAREERFGTSMSISWGNVLAERDGNKAEVRVELLFSARVDGIRQYDRQSWTFTTRLDEVWRVCSGVMDD
ncbi:hypothetical protein C1I95_21615 [Micromonospora craterilacus]|uniref:Uncharacterized protein n=1 Tax=Micromonospora craterilacus TaxID=1655439 RepID=A0A2W2EC90_9ACTN|nr:hypothetical protein [Micromonospora craterilacus]PZG14499.1 hypothetical protein C1I95_21615 [Micromonospora craterilacus]